MADIIYKVKNRSASRVGYSIPEDGIRRTFAPGEVKNITYNELLKLSYQPGGREMMVQFLQILSEAGLDKLNIHAQPEYYMSEQQVVDLLRTGTLDAFLDALDFAPVGVIDLIKKFAVQLPLNDMNKRKALYEKTGFDVTKALIHDEESKAPETEEEKVAAAAKAAAPAGRRTAANYKPATPAPAPAKTEAKS
jgi:hypothetical protein